MHNYVDKLKRNYANYSRGTMLVLVLVLVRAAGMSDLNMEIVSQTQLWDNRMTLSLIVVCLTTQPE